MMEKHPSPAAPAIHAPLPSASQPRRRWTAGELTEIVSALANLRTSEIARALGVNPKALRSALRRNGISLRAIREYSKRRERSQSAGLVVRRPAGSPSAIYGAAALERLPDDACRWSMGDPAEPDFAFCSAPVLGRWPYCPAHLAKAFHYDDSSSASGL